MTAPLNRPTITWRSPRDGASVRAALEQHIGPTRWLEGPAMLLASRDVPVGDAVTVLDARHPHAAHLLRRRVGAVIWLGHDRPNGSLCGVPPDAPASEIARVLSLGLHIAAVTTRTKSLIQDLERGEVAGVIAASPRARGALRTLRALRPGVPLWISGVPGSGRSSWARAALRLAGEERPVTIKAGEIDPDELPERIAHAWRAPAVILEEIERLPIRVLRTMQAHRTPPLLVLTSGPPPDQLAWPRGITDHLALLHLALPPLSERGPDIELLALRFLRELGPTATGRPYVLTAEAAAALRQHPWPGQVRQLREVVWRAARIAGDDPIGPHHLSGGPSVPPLEQVERELIEQALSAANGNVRAAGDALGVPRSTLYRKLKRLGLR